MVTIKEIMQLLVTEYMAILSKPWGEKEKKKTIEDRMGQDRTEKNKKEKDKEKKERREGKRERRTEQKRKGRKKKTLNMCQLGEGLVD